jgi:crotonobetainyl-CoA:carnitine CoA-transferase CaiB-like acyl-CoA transferase
MAEGVLEGVKVIDLTRSIAGPYCTKLMADYGAEVIKVEPPEGDPCRLLGPFPGNVPHQEKGGLFLFLNTNKKGVTLDLKQPKGKALLQELVKDADVLVESFPPQVMAELGLSYEALAKANPRLVMASISNFGQTGPYRDWKATEIVVEAIGGNMYISGDHDREPLSFGVPLFQFVAGQSALAGTLVALFERQRSGLGQHIDVSTAEAVAACIPYTFQYYT